MRTSWLLTFESLSQHTNTFIRRGTLDFGIPKLLFHLTFQIMYGDICEWSGAMYGIFVGIETMKQWENLLKKIISKKL